MSTSTPPLARDDKIWIHWHQHELIGLIPEPGESWHWNDVDVPHGTLCAMRNRSLIESADGQGMWETTESLWEDLQSRVEDEDELIIA